MTALWESSRAFAGIANVAVGIGNRISPGGRTTLDGSRTSGGLRFAGPHDLRLEDIPLNVVTGWGSGQWVLRSLPTRRGQRQSPLAHNCRNSPGSVIHSLPTLPVKQKRHALGVALEKLPE
jgi:hypothetical protein